MSNELRIDSIGRRPAAGGPLARRINTAKVNTPILITIMGRPRAIERRRTRANDFAALSKRARLLLAPRRGPRSASWPGRCQLAPKRAGRPTQRTNTISIAGFGAAARANRAGASVFIAGGRVRANGCCWGHLSGSKSSSRRLGAKSSFVFGASGGLLAGRANKRGKPELMQGKHRAAWARSNKKSNGV